MPETIGLDIGSHSIKLVGLQMTSKGPFLTHAGIKEIPYGDQREDPAFVSETVKALFRETGLKSGKVNLTVSDPGIHIRRIILPSMPKLELREAVRWEMKNHLPFPVESAQIDYLILEEATDKDLKRLDLIAVACPRQLIDRSLAKSGAVEHTYLDELPQVIAFLQIRDHRFMQDVFHFIGHARK